MLELSYRETSEDAKGSDSNNIKDHPYLIQPLAESSEAVENDSFEPGPLNDISWKSVEVPPAKGDASDIASQVAKLNAPGNAAVQSVVGTALKYLENARLEPWTHKFRSFKLSNKIVDRITKFEKSLDLICHLGLYIYSSEADFMACIPVGKDLEQMERDMRDILSDFPP